MMYQLITIRNEKNDIVEVGILKEINGNFPFNKIPIFDNERIIQEGAPMNAMKAKKLSEKLGLPWQE